MNIDDIKMEGILKIMYGEAWCDKFDIYQLALYTMKRGLPDIKADLYQLDR